MACSLALIMEVMRMQKKMVEEGKKRLNILLEMGLWRLADHYLYFDL